MNPLDTQVGGDHYKQCKIQPVEFVEANRMQFLEGCVIKRLARHDKPTGKGRPDIEKAIHELQLLLTLRYPYPVAPPVSGGAFLVGDFVKRRTWPVGFKPEQIRVLSYDGGMAYLDDPKTSYPTAELVLVSRASKASA